MGGFKRGIAAKLGRGEVDCAFANNIFAYAEYRFNSYGDKDILSIKVDLDQQIL